MEVSAGIVICNSRVLCMKKGKAGYEYTSDRFEFPGGKLEPGETSGEALIREFKEELDADINPEDIHHFHDLTYEYPDFTVLLHYFLVRVDEFKFTPKEHSGFVWSTPGMLQDLDWLNADAQLIREHASELKLIIRRRCNRRSPAGQASQV